MIQELVELGKRVTVGKQRALTIEYYSIVLVIDVLGRFQKFIVGDKQEILTEVITAKKGKARFLLDKCEEVLGVGKSDAQKKHELFIKKLDLYKSLSVLEPIFRFYDVQNLEGLEKAKTDFNKLDKKDKGGNITFMVDTTLLLRIEDVRAAIIKQFQINEQKQLNGEICSICGKSESPILDEPHGYIHFKQRFVNKDGKLVQKSMGHSTGQNTIVSYNENAFESYGLKGNLNSSICTSCAKNYVKALDYLESKGHINSNYYHYEHRIDISDSTIVLFWTREDTSDCDPFNTFEKPDSLWVKNLLESSWKGDYRLGYIVDTNMFYSITLTPGARTVVRDWTAISLDDYKRNLAEWFRDIEIEDYNGKPAYSPLGLLINATQSDKKSGKQLKSDMNSKTRIGTILWNAAIKGQSYKIPIEIMLYVLNRIIVGDNFTQHRAAIIKLIINRNSNKNMKSNLDEANRSVAYLCGRLFAVIESMQWKAMGKVNSGIKERYFAAAVSQPAYILGALLTKNVPIYQHKIGGYLAKELNEIAGIISESGSFPQRFTLIEQGEFALGYYFQRTHKANSENL